MLDKVTDYFQETVLPFVRERHPELLPEMSMMILGSAGLGIDDDYSDLEAAVYLDYPMWKKHGGQLQLSLNEVLLKTNPWKQSGSVISVMPHSWLLDGQGVEFLESSANLPWEEVSFETLFEAQENLVVYDPQELLSRLRSATAPQRYSEQLWKKALLLKLMQLRNEDLPELNQCVRRHKPEESIILFGHVIESLLQLGFLVCRQYYPWRTHLRWAFDRLPTPVVDLGVHLDALLESADWDRRIRITEECIAAYKRYITENKLLPGINLQCADLDEELVWADRLKAWMKPDWRSWMTRCTEMAVSNGYPASDYWVWSLWNWVNDPPEGFR